MKLNDLVRFTYFSDLNRTATHKIISRMSFPDLLDLTSSDPHWHETVVNAPQHVKPDVLMREARIENNKITGYIGLYEDGPKDTKISLDLDKTWDMIRQLRGDDYTIITKNNDLESTADEIDGYLDFLLKNRHRLDDNMNMLRFQYPSYRKIDYNVLAQLFGTFNFLDFQHDHDRNVPDDWKEDLKSLARENLGWNRFFCGFRMDIDFCNEILKQVLDGKRPKLWVFRCPLEKSNHPIRRLLKDIDPSRISRDGADYVVDRPNMFPPINFSIRNGMFEVCRETWHYYNAGVPFALG